MTDEPKRQWVRISGWVEHGEDGTRRESGLVIGDPCEVSEAQERLWDEFWSQVLAPPAGPTEPVADATPPPLDERTYKRALRRHKPLTETPA